MSLILWYILLKVCLYFKIMYVLKTDFSEAVSRVLGECAKQTNANVNLFKESSSTLHLLESLVH